jgi:nicotinate dehydrogenase subunit B
LQSIGGADLSPPSGEDVLVGVVLRPPVLHWNGKRYSGARLLALDESAVVGLPGLIRVVKDGDFVGLVALSAEAASQAVVRLGAAWSAAAGAAADQTVWRTQSKAEGEPAVSAQHSSASGAYGAHTTSGTQPGSGAQNGRRPNGDTHGTPAGSRGDTSDGAASRENSQGAGPPGAAVIAATLEHDYRWPSTPDAGGTWAVAWWHGDGLSVWSAAPILPLRRELAALTGLPLEAVRVVANGQADHSGAFDAAADATLLSRAVGRAVHVSSSRVDSLAQPSLGGMKIRAELGDDGRIVSQDIVADGASLARPSLARLLSGGTGAIGGPDLPPYRFDAASLSVPADARIAEAASRGGAQRAAQVFAQESFIDEAAAAAGADPVEYRLRHLEEDARGAALVRQVAEHAGWPLAESDLGDGAAEGAGASAGNRDRSARLGGARPLNGDAPRTGRGFAYARVIDDSVEPPQKSWSAWVAEVAVDPTDGSVDITRVVVGHDLEDMRPAASGARQIEDQVRDTTGRLLQAPAAFDDWGSPGTAITPTQIDINLDGTGSTELARAGTTVSIPTGLAWSESASLPAAAAVANAIFDATGVRLREPPFNGAAARDALTRSPRRAQRRVTGAWWGGIAAAAAGLVLTAMPWRAEIAPVVPDLSIYSAAAIDRGRLVAAAGDCVVCHTVPGGTPNTGGLALDTPFGQIITTNITPDPETGIGQWSFAAFDRAMRQGIHRDGRQLYPAFPYTDFAKLTDADMQALYAYLMSETPVRATPPETKLAFPFNVRPLMAGWNLLFHENKIYQPDESKSTVWNRGAYLVQGIGHCGACHTPRNALGAEKSGAQAWLAGGEAEGWEAPSLNAMSRSPIPWTENDFFSYLRTGFSPAHGVAAGPMAPVVQGLAELPEQDVRAMAVYLASLNATATPEPDRAAAIAALETAADTTTKVFPANGERIFEGACAVCHETRNVAPLFGVRPPLALNTNLHSAKPDNLIQVILNGIADPATGDLGYMPAFGGSLNDTQVADLVEYMRARYAPQQEAWEGVANRVKDLRKPH